MPRLSQKHPKRLISHRLINNHTPPPPQKKRKGIVHLGTKQPTALVGDESDSGGWGAGDSYSQPATEPYPNLVKVF